MPELRKYMYFGSVKFFRHIILAIIFAWIGIATVLAVFFGVKSANLEKQLEQSGAAAPASVEEYVEQMYAKGYSTAEIMDCLNNGSSETNSDNTAGGTEDEPAMATLPSQTEAVATETTVEDIIDDEDISDTKMTESSVQTEASETTAAESDILQTEPAASPVISDSDPYPELYAQRAESVTDADSKSVYLVFEDGPSENTYDLIYILKRQNVKAAFFMSAGKTEAAVEQMKAAAEAGHTIGVHSFSHDADYIYASLDNFLADFYETYKLIYDATGVHPQLYSLADSEKASQEIKDEITTEMSRRGFTLVTPNVESGDRAADKSWQNIYDNVLNGVRENSANGSASVVHLHDSVEDYTTVLTTEDFINTLKSEGYTFLPADNSVNLG